MIRGRGAHAALLASLLSASPAPAQEATNRDRSDYTILGEPYPVKAATTATRATAASLRDVDLVLGVALGGEARAYPLNSMGGPEYEVVNDTLGGQPIAATWCSIAHSGVVYDRAFDGQTLDLGNQGVDRGALVLYDRASGSWWSQVFGESVRGPLKGRRLAKVASMLTTWARWRALHPETTVGQDPAAPSRARFTEESFALMSFGGGGPIRNEDRVVGIEGRKRARAWPVRRLAGPRVVNDEWEGEPLLVILDPDDVTVRVLSRRVGARTLRFTSRPDGELTDAETRSFWDSSRARAQKGPLRGQTLTPVVATSALWYAWKTYRPETSLWEEAGPAY